MSRHRNVRSMNYSDEYDGYDDVYGHSVEDDYCMSPSEAAFLYDREGSKSKQKIGAFFQTVTDIAEETEGELESKESSLSEVDRARLETCIEQMKEAVGPSVPRQDLVNILLMYNFNVEKAVNFILDSPQYKDVKPVDKKEKDVNFVSIKSSKNFAIPKLNGVNLKFSKNTANISLTNNTSNFSSLDELSRNHLEKISSGQEGCSYLNIKNNAETNDLSTNFGTLADLTSHHLNKMNFKTKPLGKSLFPKRAGSGNSDNTSIDKISCDISSLNLTRNPLPNKPNLVKSETAVETGNSKNIPNNDWHIDLTKALRTADSAPQLRPKLNSISSSPPNREEFEFHFIDCETEVENSQVLPNRCNMDISSVLSVKNANSKKVSKFGKVLCRRYKRAKPYFIHSNNENSLVEIQPFLFDTPSPDDIISYHLNRK